MSRGDRGAQAARELGARREPAPSWQRGKKSRRAATARAAAATSAGKVDMISGCGAGCAHRRGEQRGDVTGRQRRARGALARHAAGAGAELAKGQEESTRSNGAGGSGDVGRKGRHDLGLWRGVCASQRPSSEVMSRGDRGAQAARELGARHEPAPMPTKGQEASQRCDSEAGDGGVGTEGRHDLGLWRGDGRQGELE